MYKHNFIGLAYQFWNLTREAINEMEKLGNKTLVRSKYDPLQSDEESWKEYEFKTRWNDFNIGVPILFNFYHGLELFMKGILQEIDQLPEKPSHKLSQYYKLIKENEEHFTAKLVNLTNHFLSASNPFNEFFKVNGGSVDDFYIYLRYPSSKTNGNTHYYGEIRSQEKIGLEKFKLIRQGCIDMRNAIIEWKQ